MGRAGRQGLRLVAGLAVVAGVGLGTVHAGTAQRTARLSLQGSIVFKQGANLVLTRPDGSRRRQLTFNGKKYGGYDMPTQSDRGQIAALRGVTTIVHLNRYGRRVSRPLKVATGPSNPQPLHTLAFGPDISPDGTKVAASIVLYEGQIDPNTGLLSNQIQAQTIQYFSFSPARRLRQFMLAGTDFMSPFWADNRTVVVFAPYNNFAVELYTDTVKGNAKNWFADTIDGDGVFNRKQLDKGELTRAKDKLALIRGTNLRSDWRGASIQVYSVSGFTTTPTPLCSLKAQHGAFGKVTWSPDGSTLAWSDSNGIWESAIDPAVPNCGFAPRLVIKGGSNPDWGPTGL